MFESTSKSIASAGSPKAETAVVSGASTPLQMSRKIFGSLTTPRSPKVLVQNLLFEYVKKAVLNQLKLSHEIAL